MKRPSFLPPILCAALLLASCASAPPSASPPEAGQSAPEPRRTKQGGVPRRPEARPGAELDGEAFRGLPREAKEQLALLARAFAEGDRNYLLARGEPNYERRVRPRFDEQRYAALLYRIGPYAKDAPSAPERMPSLDLAAVSRLRYTGWRETDPLVEARGKLRLADGREEDCLILLLWKTDQPFVLGKEP